MDRKIILYRGSLKSCNYTCSYCPFAKHPSSCREQDKDKMEWQKFCKSLTERAKGFGRFALMVVPYGEALIYPWYWEGLAALSRLEAIEAVGVQTNLSFSLDKAMKRWEGAGGKKEKLHLWATFHPEMVSPERFAQKCREIFKEGIALCAGAVGVPENLPFLAELRRLLPDSLAFWINAMDGLQRPYTKEEEQAFSALDPFFLRELEAVPALPENCKNRLFIEGSGRMHTCNISPVLPGNWYQEDFSFPPPMCRKKFCSCYLAYGSRGDWVNFLLFGDYPVFRIPQYFSAVFLDIDGTLIPPGERALPPLTKTSLKALAKTKTRLFFATSLPLPEARKKCRDVWECFDGGIFAGGAHLCWKKEHENPPMPWDQEIFYPLKEDLLPMLKEQEKKFSCRLYAYKNKGKLYKITLVRSPGRVWEKEEENFLRNLFSAIQKKSLRILREENCLQILPAQASKENGVRLICQKLGISPKQAAAVGNSAEDEGMLVLCTKGIKLTCIK